MTLKSNMPVSHQTRKSLREGFCAITRYLVRSPSDSTRAKTKALRLGRTKKTKICLRPGLFRQCSGRDASGVRRYHA
jgi:hypothetical protein